MKTRFNTIDISAALSEINERAVGLRLVNVYDVDHKTYLFKLSKTDLKIVLLIESGVRIHLSEFDWPKNNIPSGFAMKMRKHLRGRRLVSATQLGSDRIVDLQFGSDEAAYHVILELYDRGNIALTDHEDVILTLLRFRKDQGELGKNQENEDVRCAVHEPYPRQLARPVEPLISIEKLRDIFQEAKKDALLKRFLVPYLPYGAACIDHCLSIAGFGGNVKIGKDFTVEKDLESLYSSLAEAENYLAEAKLGKCKGFIIQKSDKKLDGELLTNIEFHPFLFNQHQEQPFKEFTTFNEAVDEFYSSLESQKHDLKALQREKAALRKLENVRRDHDTRLQALRSEQDEDKRKASVIENNLELVDQAIRVICSAIANQVDWDEIRTLVTDAQAKGDVVALSIRSLKLETNVMVLALNETGANYDDYDSSDFSDEDAKKSTLNKKPIKVEIDLSLSAYANAQKYYNKKRQAAQKEQRTMDASKKAFKSAEKKTAQTLKEANVISNIQKARKTFWFEKFLWFISSENYLVLGGRDAQQNELLVKKYLKPGDAYVHADLHGATSCIIKNNSSLPIPPKTLNEAGTMAICHSAAWDAKVVTSAWWVHRDQVSKTAPSGEYLTTGSFLIRGKKNYLPPSYLVYGFGFLFKVDETCIWKHKGERKVKSTDDDLSSVTNSVAQMEELAILSEDDIASDVDSQSTATRDQIDFSNANQAAPREDALADSDGGEPASPLFDKSESNLTSSLVSAGERHSSEVDVKICNEKSEQLKDDDGEVGNDNRKVSVNNKVLEFPDTKVKVPFEDKYHLDTWDDQQEDDFVYLGDDNPIKIDAETNEKHNPGKARMSAKQKRELKKLQKKKQLPRDEADTLPNVPETADDSGAENKKSSNQSNLPYVRGQKKKLARLRRKQNFENDNDNDEDKKLMMEMLQASKPMSEKKKRKNKNAQEKDVNTQKPKKKPSGPKPEKKQDAKQKLDSDEERELALKEEHLNLEEVNNALDSLTGIPATDDILLFAIPVCAPYNTMQNYKFKVKLTPGPGKKGKAGKTAINIFQSMRETTAMEKDHFRSVKDNDLSRNMPGKVKVSAPNMQKLKAKKR